MNTRREQPAAAWVYAAVIALVGFAVYANALNGAFIWDDYAYIKDNAFIRDISCAGSLFFQRVGEGYAGAATPSLFYRPLQSVLYASAYALWGLEPLGYHLISILLHIGVALCLFWLIAALFADRPLAGLTALLYVVHPAHVEVVANASGTADPLSAFLLLASFICYLRNSDALRGLSFAGMLFFFAAALLTKESALVFPLALLFYHYVFQKKVSLRLFLPVAGMALLYLLWRGVVLGSSLVDTGRFSGALARVPGFFAGLAVYLRILFFPVGLHVHYGDLLFTFADPRAWAGAALFVFLAVAAVRSRRRDPLFLFSAGWFFIFLLPVTNIYRVNDSFIKEHWLYLPSVGFFLILSRALLSFYRRGGRRRALGLSGIVLAVAFFAACTIRLNLYWADPITFLERSIRYRPDYAVFYNELGTELEAQGRVDEAVALYGEALKRGPGLTAVYLNLGRSLAAAGRFTEAVDAYRCFLASHPEEFRAYFYMAGCFKAMGKDEEAAALVKTGREKALEREGQAQVLSKK